MLPSIRLSRKCANAIRISRCRLFTGFWIRFGNPADGKHYFDITVGNHHHLFDGQKIADYDDPELTRLIYRYLAGKLPGDTNIDKIQVQIIINHLKSE